MHRSRLVTRERLIIGAVLGGVAVLVLFIVGLIIVLGGKG
jgi:Ca2+/Na+ antiporter